MYSKMIELVKAIDKMLEQELLAVWEDSVRATHSFLSEKEITEIKPFTREAFSKVDSLAYIRDKDGVLQAFIGIDGQKIEMLFVSSVCRGQGYGKKLISYAVNKAGATYVDVNEQNPQAVGFYEHLGFSVFDRSPVDDQGRAFPILHMVLMSPDRLL